MPLQHPFAWLPDWTLWPLFILFTVGAIAVAVCLARIGAPIDRVLTSGTLAIEAPWSSRQAEAVRQALAGPPLAVAIHQTRVDFLFLLLYPIALSAGCALASSAMTEKGQLIGVLVSWSVLLACPLDALENVGILRMLRGDTAPPFPQITTVCAAVKFTLVFGAFAYLAIAVVTLLARLMGSR